MSKLHYECMGGMLVRREGMLHWRCPVCREEGASEQVLSECPHASKHARFKVEKGVSLFIDHHANGQRGARRQHEQTVTKVGRAWIYFGSNDSRVCRADLEARGWAPAYSECNSSDDVYVSRDIYEAVKAERALRFSVRELMTPGGVAAIPLDKLRQIAAILEIEHEVPADWQ